MAGMRLPWWGISLSLMGMILGILSDTHDRVEMAARAVARLKEHQVAFFIHCGDVCNDLVLDQLAGLPSAFVFGNCDWDRDLLRRYASIVGVRCCERFGEFEFDGKRLAVAHGDDPAVRRRIIEGQRHDYFLQGHTHLREDDRIGRVRTINPGALHRAAEKSVAVLDTASDSLTFLTIA